MAFYNNFYVKDYFRKIKYFEVNRKIDRLLRSLEQIDSIENYHSFRNYVVENNISQKSSIFMKHEFGEEGLLYGNRRILFKYADYNSKYERFIFPYLEHGADLRENVNVQIYDRFHYSFIFQSDYKNKLVHIARPLAPVFNVGPYILYADNYYDDIKLKQIKEKLGKTVVLFPAHTFEGAKVEFDKNKFVENVMSKFGKLFDTILVCVYWNDVEDPIYDTFEKEGAKLVSAGFRGDYNFINRQRTIIELSDMVASNMLGSYIGYSQALGKPFYMFEEQALLVCRDHIIKGYKAKKYNNLIKIINYAFSDINSNDKKRIIQKAIYERYWGGRFFKSKEDIRNIISLQLKLLKAGEFNTKGIERIISLLIDGKNVADLSDLEVEILFNALERNSI